MILKFCAILSLMIGVFYSIFNIYQDAACTDTASYAITKLSLRKTLTKTNYVSQINDLSDKTNLLCQYYITNKESQFTINRLYKEKKTLELNLKTSITNE